MNQKINTYIKKSLHMSSVDYVICQAFMAHIVWYENMELISRRKKTKAQTEQKYAIWCSFWYLDGQRWNSDSL